MFNQDARVCVCAAGMEGAEADAETRHHGAAAVAGPERAAADGDSAMAPCQASLDLEVTEGQGRGKKGLGQEVMAFCAVV